MLFCAWHNHILECALLNFVLSTLSTHTDSSHLSISFVKVLRIQRYLQVSFSSTLLKIDRNFALLIKTQQPATMTSSIRWVLDHEVNNCSQCQDEFSLLRRKHHCRVCASFKLLIPTTKLIQHPNCTDDFHAPLRTWCVSSFPFHHSLSLPSLTLPPRFL